MKYAILLYIFVSIRTLYLNEKEGTHTTGASNVSQLEILKYLWVVAVTYNEVVWLLVESLHHKYLCSDGVKDKNIKHYTIIKSISI